MKNLLLAAAVCGAVASFGLPAMADHHAKAGAHADAKAAHSYSCPKCHAKSAKAGTCAKCHVAFVDGAEHHDAKPAKHDEKGHDDHGHH